LPSARTRPTRPARRRDPAGRYNREMARGWESKSVESQIESAEATRSKSNQRPTPGQQEAGRERQRLELSRTYLLQRIALAANPAYTHALEQALKEIEEKLARLEGA
jgi:hypothetical protein